MIRKLFIAVCVFLSFATVALAAEHPLPDADEEARAYAMFHQIRCSFCEANSLADSPADAAAELRNNIRTHIASGDSDIQVKAYLKTTYGDKIKIGYSMAPMALAVEYGPMVLLGGVFIFALIFLRRADRDDSAKKK